MKVRSYITLLTVGSLGGASLIALLGWYTFSGLKTATQSLQEEAQKTGDSSEEYSDVKAFLATTRSIFVSLEIYPRAFSGIFSVSTNAMVLSKESLNHIAKKYSFNYPKSILEPIEIDLRLIEEKILQMQKESPWSKDNTWEQRNRKARAEYEKVRDKLKRSLDGLEILAEEFRIQAERDLNKKKWL